MKRTSRLNNDPTSYSDDDDYAAKYLKSVRGIKQKVVVFILDIIRLFTTAYIT